MAAARLSCRKGAQREAVVSLKTRIAAVARVADKKAGNVIIRARTRAVVDVACTMTGTRKFKSTCALNVAVDTGEACPTQAPPILMNTVVAQAVGTATREALWAPVVR